MPAEEKEEIREFNLQPGYIVRVTDASSTTPTGFERVCKRFAVAVPMRLVLEPRHMVSKARLLSQREQARRDLAYALERARLADPDPPKPKELSMKKRIRALQAELDVIVDVTFGLIGKIRVQVSDSSGCFGLATKRSGRKALELAVERYRRALKVQG